MRNVIALVLGGGRGTRLYPLTKYRSKPAVPLAGKYRLIDIPLSNCINSGINRMYVLTQFISVSLHRHIRQTYRSTVFSGGFVEILAAQQTIESVRLVSGHRRRRPQNAPLPPAAGHRLRADPLRRSALSHGLRGHAAHAPRGRRRCDDRRHARDARRGRRLRHHAGRRHGSRAGLSGKAQDAQEMDMVTMTPEWIDARGIRQPRPRPVWPAWASTSSTATRWSTC